MIGDKKWESGMAGFCKPFTGAKIRYFDVTNFMATSGVDRGTLIIAPACTRLAWHRYTFIRNDVGRD